MVKLLNDRFIRALLRQPVDRTPIWIMRQAGRYLPEYRALRAQVPSFMEFCKNPELACEVTLQPLRRFDLDAAIIFSDILTIPDAMGMDLEFVAGEGPVIHNPIQTQADVDRLIQPDVSQDLGYVMEAIQLVINELNGKVPLIGFAGSPWTVACYMVEGGSSKLFQQIKRMMYRTPTVLHSLLQRVTEATIAYLNAQVQAGAQALMVFDTWGGVLSPACYQAYSLAYMKAIASGVTRSVDGQQIPLVFFTKNGGQYLELIAGSGCDAAGLDWTCDINQARARVGDKIALQGNMDPCVLFADAATIRREAEAVLAAYGSGAGHVFNLGHGIDKNTPIESVSVLVDTVHNYRLQS